MRERGQTTPFQARLVEISEHAAAGLNDTHIEEVVGCSVWTVRNWRRRVTPQGRVGLTSHMRRPAGGRVSTFPYEMKEAILQPVWGPATLLIVLKADERWRDQPLPTRYCLFQWWIIQPSLPIA